MSDRIYNFSAGPAVLPEPVLRKAQDALWNFEGSGIGVMEHSHRGPEFSATLERAEALCRELGRIPDGHRVLFLQGGASSQFFTLAMNLLTPDATADYIDTGVWSQKAVAEAERFGRVHLAYRGQESDYRHIPEAGEIEYSDDPAYVHFTSNNTIYGTQFQAEPDIPAGAPLICDASSDIFSRPIELSRYGLLYAGAQKNLGPAGLTLVIIDDALVARGAEELPTMLQYRTHADKGSRYNTPPTFAIYILAEVLAWLKDLGGLEAMAEYNRDKAQLIYDFLDQSALFHGTVEPASRSLMNICFRCRRTELEEPFVQAAQESGLSGLGGHRTVGGMRASVYNAFPREGCEALVAFMKRFEREHA